MQVFPKNAFIKIIPTFKCNLACQHCDVLAKQNKYAFNEKAFFAVFDQLDSTNDIMLFGGEPFLNSYSILEKILSTNKIKSTTSNLLLLNEKILDLLIKHNVTLGTSWNPSRFSNEQYDLWKENIKLVKSANKYLELFVTLTDDLFIDENLFKFTNMLYDVDYIGIDRLTLSMVIPSNDELVKKADALFCYLDDNWDWNFTNRISDQLLVRLKTPHKTTTNSCNRVWTLYPNGQLENVCTHSCNKIVPKFKQCQNCNFKIYCNRCQRQPCCTFLKRFAIKLMKKHKII